MDGGALARCRLLPRRPGGMTGRDGWPPPTTRSSSIFHRTGSCSSRSIPRRRRGAEGGRRGRAMRLLEAEAIVPGRIPEGVGGRGRNPRRACYTASAEGMGARRGRDETRSGGMMAKHIFVTGGVVSSLGKGLTCASIGMLLEHRGLRVRLQKFDPYINVDPGTMSPYQHGEVYVLDDGAETDLDLGHYERFTNAPLTRDCNYTTGKIYLSVIEKERRGRLPRQDGPGHPARHRRDQGGHPQAGDRRRGRGHHRDRRHRRRHRGPAVPRGDPPVRPRRRQAQLPVHPPDAGPVPQGGRRAEDQADAALASASCGRSASSPTSSSAAPSARSPEDDSEKIALFCNVERRAVIEERDKEFSIYEVPLSLVDNKLDELIVEKLGLQAAPAGHRRLARAGRPDHATPTTR